MNPIGSQLPCRTLIGRLGRYMLSMDKARHTVFMIIYWLGLIYFFTSESSYIYIQLYTYIYNYIYNIYIYNYIYNIYIYNYKHIYTIIYIIYIYTIICTLYIYVRVNSPSLLQHKLEFYQFLQTLWIHPPSLAMQSTKVKKSDTLHWCN